MSIDNSSPQNATADNKLKKVNQLRSNQNYKLMDELKTIALKNEEFYKSDSSGNGTRLFECFTSIVQVLMSSRNSVEVVESFAGDYDFDENTPGNGYWSFLNIYFSALTGALKTANYIFDNRNSLLFRKSYYLKEIDVWSQILISLEQIFGNLIKIHSNSENGNLYSKDKSWDNLLTRASKVVNQYCFYGRFLGFQYNESIQTVLKFITISMATFSEAYYSGGNQFIRATKMVAGSKFYLDPELCARRIVNCTHNADIEFCKAFWLLNETKLMHTMPSIVGYSLKVNRVITIPPEPFKIPSSNSKGFVDVPIPSSYTGVGPVFGHLLCAKSREGTMGEGRTSDTPKSKYLIFHCHGGGWVAQSSFSHEFYLREWAYKLDVPIFSIDYSLAPEAPFPRGLEDVFYAYCWTLDNLDLLGTTGENIVLIGDSAGGNLNTSVVLKCIEMGIRVPDGLFLAYTPFSVNFETTPSRFLSLTDPLLPYGFIMNIFKSYSQPPSVVKKDDKNGSIGSDESEASYEALWKQLQTEDDVTWRTNLSSIDEVSPEGLASPFSPTSPTAFPGDFSRSFSSNSASSYQDKEHTIEIKLEKRYSTPPSALEGPSTSKQGNYVGGFVEKYTQKKEHDLRPVSRTASEEDIVFAAGRDVPQTIQEKISAATSSIVNTIISPFKPIRPHQLNLNSHLTLDDPAEMKRILDSPVLHTPSDKWNFNVKMSPLMSPFYAEDQVLAQFPPTRIVSTHLDPCLDDCVMFSKKLKGLKVDIEINILDGLPHGFLNFGNINKESHDGSLICMNHIGKLLNIDMDQLKNKD